MAPPPSSVAPSAEGGSDAAGGGPSPSLSSASASGPSRRRRFAPAATDAALFLFSLSAFLLSLASLHEHAGGEGGGGGGAGGRDGGGGGRGSPSGSAATSGGRPHMDDAPAENRPLLGRRREDAAKAVAGEAATGTASATTARRTNGTDFSPAAGAAEEGKSNPVEEQKPPEPESRSSGETTTATKPMNILLLYADDWRHDTLGAAGNPVVRTPALDKLASQGVRFTHNCVTTSVCWSSRVTLYTGEYTGRHNTTRPKFFYADWHDTVYDLLQEKGYHVGHVGKWGVNHPYKRRIPFSVEDDGWHYRQFGPKLWHVTEKNEADALRFLETRPRDKPFFVNVAFFATHAVDGDKRQYLPQNSSMKLYADDVVPNPVTNTLESFRRLPHFFTDRNEGRTRWRWRYDTEEKRQTMMKNYYRMATEVDSACGVILKELELQGELDNTLVIFTTDNGNFHAEHGLADKWYPHQESIRVPLIVRDPRMDANKAGTTNDEFTLNIDLAPTMLAAAGVVPPDKMMGRDVSVLYRTADDGGGRARPSSPPTARRAEERSPWRTEFFYEHPVIVDKNYIPASEALVRKDYKYMYWPDYGVQQLFDLRADPTEDGDLLGTNAPELSGTQKATLEEMQGRFHELKRLVQGTRDPVIL